MINVTEHDKLIIGRFCSIACGAKFLFTSANHTMKSLSTYPFPIFFEEWGLEIKNVASAWRIRKSKRKRPGGFPPDLFSRWSADQVGILGENGQNQQLHIRGQVVIPIQVDFPDSVQPDQNLPSAQGQEALVVGASVKVLAAVEQGELVAVGRAVVGAEDGAVAAFVAHPVHMASSVETPTVGRERAKASPLAAATPMRIPVNEPGPAATAMAPRSEVVRSALRSMASTMGIRVRLWVRPVH